MSIDRILRCDGCYASTSAGATPARDAREARSARHAGTIRRVRMGHATYGSSRKFYRSRDLCADCRTPEEIAHTRTLYRGATERGGGVWTDAKAGAA